MVARIIGERWQQDYRHGTSLRFRPQPISLNRDVPLAYTHTIIAS